MRVFKPSLSACAVLFGVALAAPSQVFAQNNPATPPVTAPDENAFAKQEVTRAEQELARASTLVQQGTVSTTELSDARVRLAQARLQLAQQQNQFDTVVQQAQIIVDERAQAANSILVAYKAGVTTQSDLNAARLALAEARVNLDLYTLIGIKRENAAIALRLYQAGVVSKADTQQTEQAAELGRIQALLSAELNKSQKPEQKP